MRNHTLALQGFLGLLCGILDVSVSAEALAKRVGADLVLALFRARVLQLADEVPLGGLEAGTADDALAGPSPGERVVATTERVLGWLRRLLQVDTQTRPSRRWPPGIEPLGSLPWQGEPREAVVVLAPPSPELLGPARGKPPLVNRPLLLVPTASKDVPPLVMVRALQDDVLFLGDMLAFNGAEIQPEPRARWTASRANAPTSLTELLAPDCIERDPHGERTITRKEHANARETAGDYQLFVDGTQPEGRQGYFAMHRRADGRPVESHLSESELLALLTLTALPAFPVAHHDLAKIRSGTWDKVIEALRKAIDVRQDNGGWLLIHTLPSGKAGKRHYFDPAATVRYRILRPLNDARFPLFPGN